MSSHPLEGRVLVAQTAYLGDVTLTTALLGGLRRGLRPRQLDLLVGRPYAELLAGSPDVDRVLCFDKRGADKGVRGLIRAARRLRGNYDAAIVPVRSFRTAVLVARAGIPWRSGFGGGLGSALFTRTTKWEAALTHVERLARLAPEVPWNEVGLKTRLAVTEDERRSATELLRAAGLDLACPMVAVHPGSTWATKRWPAERFGEVARSLAASGVQVCVLGTAEDVGLGDTVVGVIDAERKAAIRVTGTGDAAVTEATGANGEAVARDSGTTARAVNLCGRTGLGQLKAILAHSRLLLTNDSGPMHVAEAVGTPVVAIFGSTTPRQGFAPTDPRSRVVEVELDCRPCGRHGRNACPLGHFRCMLDLPAATVTKALRAPLPGP